MILLLVVLLLKWSFSMFLLNEFNFIKVNLWICKCWSMLTVNSMTIFARLILITFSKRLKLFAHCFVEVKWKVPKVFQKQFRYHSTRFVLCFCSHSKCMVFFIDELVHIWNLFCFICKQLIKWLTSSSSSQIVCVWWYCFLKRICFMLCPSSSRGRKMADW